MAAGGVLIIVLVSTFLLSHIIDVLYIRDFGKVLLWRENNNYLILALGTFYDYRITDVTINIPVDILYNSSRRLDKLLDLLRRCVTVHHVK